MGGDGIVIFPKDALNNAGPHIIGNVRVLRRRIDELPMSCREIIEAMGIKGPYYIGYADEAQLAEELKLPADTFMPTEKLKKMNKVKVTYLINIIEEQARFINFQDDMLKDKTKKIERTVAAQMRMAKRYSEPRSGLLDKLRSGARDD